jgi:hypothetical protein
MQKNTLPKTSLFHKSIGKRDTGRPRKKWKEQLLDEADGKGFISLKSN